MNPVQTTISVKRPMMNLPKHIPVKALLFNATSNHFFDSHMIKNFSKTTTTKLYPAKECKKHKEKFIKNKHLSDYIYSIANLYRKVCLMPTKAGEFIKSYKIM